MTHTLSADDKLVPMMIYTPQQLIWGKAIAKQAIRVSTWLQNEMAPDYFQLLDAQAVLFGAGASIQTLKFPILHVATHQILAYHILPPADESPYFDQNEPNRKMTPLTVITGVFRFDCEVRIAQQSEVKIFLGVQKSTFMPVFNIQMTCPLLPAIKGIRAPYMLIRQNAATFAEDTFAEDTFAEAK